MKLNYLHCIKLEKLTFVTEHLNVGGDKKIFSRWQTVPDGNNTIHEKHCVRF